MADLLPCPTPWCEMQGGEPYVFERRRGIFGVYCPSCFVTTPYFPTQEEAIAAWNTRHDHTADLLEALRPFVDLGPQQGAWGVISKKLDGMAPLTVTVTKAQMLAALAAISRARNTPDPVGEARHD